MRLDLAYMQGETTAKNIPCERPRLLMDSLAACEGRSEAAVQAARHIDPSVLEGSMRGTIEPVNKLLPTSF